jgi:3',5'-cyclic-AMP phosphodiesterase
MTLQGDSAMVQFNRRNFLFTLGGTAALTAVPGNSFAANDSRDAFEFIFFTDAHIEPELNAAKGCEMAFQKLRSVKSDFVIQGGDHVYDAMNVSKDRAKAIYDLYIKTEQDLGAKVYHTCGNHDCFGISSKGKIGQSDQLYGKKMFEERFGQLYYSFDHKGVHFVVLDSVDPLPEGQGYRGFIDDAQMTWLSSDLTKLSQGTPVIVSIHIPLVTAIPSYSPLTPDHRFSRTIENSDTVLKLLERHNVIGVLQGHTHIWEQIVWHNIPYVTGGAVSGNWWRGTRLGTAEGFTVVRVADGKMSVRYETYGFQSVAPQNT